MEHNERYETIEREFDIIEKTKRQGKAVESGEADGEANMMGQDEFDENIMLFAIGADWFKEWIDKSCKNEADV